MLKEKVIIFGVNDFAQLAHYYLTNDSEHEVVAFSVHQAYIKETSFFGLPVVPFETVETFYPPTAYAFFAPMSPAKMNRVRHDVYHEIKAKRYRMISYVSSKSTHFNNQIGDNCFILEDNTIQPFVTIGHNVVMWSGNHIGHHSEIKDHVMFTSHVVLSGHCVVEPFSFFGVNSTIRDGLVIAEGSLISMAAAVFKNTEPWSVYKGNPAVKSSVSSRDIHF
ncbi:acetyltransferase [Undibacterium sp. LX40W]|uniref:Acetyltransferase n=1 Tax=Undibacterium nitidum TaxID=2762298 RepID=A0A923HKZ7_9BURK|nr:MULTISPECIES: acetyltransferase [Undibacterium]MBC3880288.1 acetyltransferase [Undibacterium nitidum]MBC3890976.1 acetyltransferase [Undibacterium sp. LX40W]